MIKSDTQIFAACPNDADAVAAAKEYIRKNELTKDDVKLGSIGNVLVIVTKREIKLLF